MSYRDVAVEAVDVIDALCDFTARSLAGERVATAMEMRYVHGLPWAVAARRMGYSPRSGQLVVDLCRAGLDVVDSHRLMAVVRGEGDAT